MITNKEIEEVGESIAKKYLMDKKAVICMDIENFITDFLKLSIRYESIAEDNDEQGFISDGKYPLSVFKCGKIVKEVFPVNTIVIDSTLLNAEYITRLRFVLSHEASHYILNQMTPCSRSANFNRIVDTEREYTVDEFWQRMNIYENQVNRMAAVILMPKELVLKALRKHTRKRSLTIYGDNTLGKEDKIIIINTAHVLGVSFSALYYRLKEMNMFVYKPIEDYIKTEMKLGAET